MFDWQGFSPKHLKFIMTPLESHKRIVILKGAIRSGKTTAMEPKWLQFISSSPESLKIIAGVSKDTVYDNVLRGLFEFYDTFGIKYNYSLSSGTLKTLVNPKKRLWSVCKVIGAQNAGSEEKIRGKTLGGAYVDELSLINYNFFKELLGRCSCKGAKIFCTTNPDSPNHWHNKEFGEDNPDVEILRFSLDDNKVLSEEYKEFIKRQYKGVFYSRFIEGKDVVAEGLVYDTFCPEKHTCQNQDVISLMSVNAFPCYFLGVDWGWQHPCACLLFGKTAQGVFYLIDELCASKLDAVDVANWIIAKQKEYGRFFKFVNCDNARPEQNHKLRQLTGLIILENKPRVEDSIATVRSLINFDRLIINKDKCPKTLDEITSWAYKEGEDVPVKEHDDCMDAMRYAIFEVVRRA